MSLTDEDKRWIKNELAQQLELMETRLLTEFHKWASPVEMRQRSRSAALRAHDVELEAHADRIDKLEHPPSS